jgi:PAS domain S-box-containing protein
LTFAFFVLTQGVWSLSYMMIYPATNPETIRYWYAVGGFGWIPLQSAGTHFVLVFTGRNRLLKRWWIYPVLYGPPALFLYQHLTDSLVTEAFGIGPYGVYQTPATDSPWFWAFFAYVVASVLTRSVLLLRYYRQGRDTIAGRQGRLLAVVDFSTVALILLSNYLIPASGGTQFPSLGAVLVIPLPLAVWYVIKRQRFLSYNLYFRFQDHGPSSLSAIYREIFNVENIFDAVESGVALVDNQFRVVRTNKVLGTWFADDVDGRLNPCYRALYRRNSPCERCPIGLPGQNDATTRDTVEIARDHGQRHIYHRTMFPVREASGRTSGVMEILRDVTLHRQTERERGYLLHAVENTPIHILIAELDGSVLYANRAFLSAMALSGDEVKGRKFWEFYSRFNESDKIEEIRGAAAGEDRWQGPIVAPLADGEAFAGRMTVTPMIKSDPPYILAYIVDTTEEERVHRMREDVERTIRHDLKSPLTAILGMADMLLADLPAGGSRDLAAGIKDGANRMRDMLNSSFDLFKMDEGTYELHPKLESLREIVEGSIAEIEGLAEKRGITVAEPNPQLEDARAPQVLGERLHLQRMVTNLLKNAVEAAPCGSAVTYELEPVEIEGHPHVELSIHNQGIVPRNVRATLFQAYATSGKPQGTGLGLFSARLVARAHSGDIRYQSRDGFGTVFTVTLPAAKATAKSR